MARPRASATTSRSTMVKSKDRATSSVASRRAVLKRLRDEQIEHILFWFTDLEGHLKSFAVTPSEMEGALDDDGARRLVHHRVQRDRGVRHGRDPRSCDVPDHAAARRRARPRARRQGRAADLRRRQARRRSLRRRPALRPPGRARTGCASSASTRSTSAPSSSTSCSRTTRTRRRSTRAGTSR